MQSTFFLSNLELEQEAIILVKVAKVKVAFVRRKLWISHVESEKEEC